MRDKRAVIHGWLRKAESDLTTLELCLANTSTFDTACFHAQQVVEKYLKAYLTWIEVEFPYIHNLEKLIELCARYDTSFLSISGLGVQLTPYAVAIRYDVDFWPTLDDAREAYALASAIRDFILARLPADLRDPATE